MKYIIITLFVVILAGCSTTQTVHTNSAVNISDDLYKTSLQKAEKLKLHGRYEQALIEYRKIMTETKDVTVHNQACLQSAQCLIAMDNTPGALIVLRSLHLYPESEQDRYILAVAGEEMLRIDKHLEAESFLEISLDNINEVQNFKSWQAAACANLAYAYLLNNKPQKAVIMFYKAADIYKQRENFKMSAKNHQTAKHVEAILNNKD